MALQNTPLFSIWIILSRRRLRNSRQMSEGLSDPPSLPKAGHKIIQEKGALPVP